jgi:uncharacterized protein YukE
MARIPPRKRFPNRIKIPVRHDTIADVSKVLNDLETELRQRIEQLEADIEDIKSQISERGWEGDSSEP